MTKPPEFNKTTSIKIEFAGREYWVHVDEYGAADVAMSEGQTTRWRVKVGPGKTLAELWSPFIAPVDSEWIERLDALIAMGRKVVTS